MARRLLGSRWLLLAGLVLLPAGAASGRAQIDQYETQYGATADVSVDDLLQMPESYLNRAVHTRGTFELLPSVRRERYTLRGTFGGRINVTPVSEAASFFEMYARQWIGGEVEITGVFGQGTDPDTGQTAYVIAAWAIVGPPDEKAERRGPVVETTLEELVTKAGRLDGKVVRVRGQFRGLNLFGDLPSASRKRSSDWVIKEELFAAWVTGRKPKGSGWVFDPGLRRDTGKWLEVTGRVSTARGVVTLEARDLALVAAPAEQSSVQAAQPPPLPPPRPQKPPVVVFSLPLDGEREVPANTVFRVQFSRDMDEGSFKGRVVLRYAGRAQPGDRELDAVRIGYQLGTKTLEVDPGDLLRPGRIVELLLLPGIVDLDGRPLERRPERNPGSAADVLRFQIASSALVGGGGR